MVLKHIEDNMAYYENALGVTKEILRDTSKWLKDARNHLAHESLHGVSRDELMKSFEHADKIALLTHKTTGGRLLVGRSLVTMPSALVRENVGRKMAVVPARTSVCKTRVRNLF